jgi:hypothetical protein
MRSAAAIKISVMEKCSLQLHGHPERTGDIRCDPHHGAAPDVRILLSSRGFGAGTIPDAAVGSDPKYDSAPC